MTDEKYISVDVTRLLTKSTLVYEYILETEWLTNHLDSLGVREPVKALNVLDVGLPTARFMYERKSSTDDSSDTRGYHSMILLPYVSNEQTDPVSSSSQFPCFEALTPDDLRQAMLDGSIPKTAKALLASSRPLRLRYADHLETKQPILAKLPGDKSPVPHFLLVDPMMPPSLPAVLKNLHPYSQWNGVLSPLSPTPQESTSSFMNGGLPTHVPRNRAKLCSLHQDKTVVIQNREKSKETRTNTVWNWDKTEPLSLFALCSCTNDSLARIWDIENRVHETYCNNMKPEQTTPENIDWDVVKEGNFEPFLTDVNAKEDGMASEYKDLHYCLACGGLTYIPFSFVEVCLNREIPTVTDLVRKLPIPIPTDLLCDGMRTTVSLAARTYLHEWLIVKALVEVDLERTVSAYQVCSVFIYPFYNTGKVSAQPQESGCARHNLVHFSSDHRWSKSDPSRLVQQSARRPYCLTKRSPITQGSAPEWLMEQCKAWLAAQF